MADDRQLYRKRRGIPHVAATSAIVFAAVCASYSAVASWVAADWAPVHAAESRTQDRKAAAKAAAIKAALVFKMGGYITRMTPAPPEKNAAHKPGARPFRIGLVGTDVVAAVAKKILKGKKLQKKRPVLLEPLTVTSAVKKATSSRPGCDIVYLAKSLTDQEVRSVMAAYAKSPTVLVCERAGFANAGGGVQLFQDGKSIRFQINHKALKKQGLRVASQVMKLSRKGPEK